MTQHKPIIYGPDGHPIVRARDRLAPKPSVSAGLEGWVGWQLIDRQGRAVSGGEQHNLILDTFLDQIGTTQTLDGLASLHNFLSHFAVGVGSVAPDVTDTALDSELARTATQTASSTTRVANGVYELMLEREFDFGVGNGNLTEFGFAAGASSQMLVRELFRDAGGNPVTITKTSSYKLRIRYTLTVTLSPVTLATPASFTIAGLGVINGAHSWNGSRSGNDLFVFARLAQGRVQNFPTGGPVVKPRLVPTVFTEYSTDLSSYGSGDMSNVDSTDAYVPGSYERAITTSTWETGNGNVAGVRCITVHPVNHSGSNQERAGWGFAIDQADAISKDNLHTLTLQEVLSVVWGRAA